jgi:hypothetical protein
MSGQVVLDSTNLDAIIKDATGEGITQPELPLESSSAATIEAKVDQKVTKVANEEVKVDPATDDIEGEDGITPRQRRDFTKSMLATIGKKHRRQMEAEEFAKSQYHEAQLAEQRATKLEADLSALREQLKPEPKPEEIKEPDRKDFKDDQAFWDAMVDYRVDKKLRDQQAAQAKRQDEEFQSEAAAHAQTKMDRAFEIGPEDFKEVFEAADMIMPTYVLNAIKESELMPEMVYFFGKDDAGKASAEKISAMTRGLRAGSPAFIKAAQRQLVELGKIESTLQPFVAAKAAKESDGAKPSEDTTVKVEPTETGTTPSKPRVVAPIIKPLNGGSASQVEKDEADLTGSQIIDRWQRKHKVALTARKRH